MNKIPATDTAADTSETAAVPAIEPTALPDRLSTDPRSRYHVAEVFTRDIGILLGGKELTNVEEYCISEGWVKVPAGKTRDRKGQPLLIKLKGTVQAFYK
ncbi:MAG: glutathione peroxidase [Comamonadaceae bacterium CG1_02_60_18]|nr:MAG: glutathione peroxidase [Comamonadaceae bacterium CG1_02_60_18]PIQ55470.1 MAG: glutathione peroxidase [Comamonadaceae bacterium CG12_big_fil_rev_8_21_14_0_65_59_15]